MNTESLLNMHSQIVVGLLNPHLINSKVLLTFQCHASMVLTHGKENTISIQMLF